MCRADVVAAGVGGLGPAADVLANSAGRGRGYIRQKIRDREATAVDLVKGDIASELGGRGDYFAILEAKHTERATKAKPLIWKAFAEPIATCGRCSRGPCGTSVRTMTRP